MTWPRRDLMLSIMRTLALMAFFALQLSIFTCGFDIHVHAMVSDIGHVAGHLHDDDSNHEQGSAEHGCHVHATHTLAAFDADYVGHIVPAVSTVRYHLLSEPILKKLAFLIDHPPKHLHS